MTTAPSLKYYTAEHAERQQTIVTFQRCCRHPDFKKLCFGFPWVYTHFWLRERGTGSIRVTNKEGIYFHNSDGSARIGRTEPAKEVR